MNKLLGFYFVIEYRAGCENVVGKGLSRQFGFTCQAISIHSLGYFDTIYEEVKKFSASSTINYEDCPMRT